MNTTNEKPKRYFCAPGMIWAAVWPNGRTLWSDTVRRKCVRAAKGTTARVVQQPKISPEFQ